MRVMSGKLKEPWYHLNTNRLKSEEILLAHGKDGAFLVRESESLVNAHVLSLLFQDGVQHYRILQTGNKTTLQASEGVQQCFFESLCHLISYYMVPGPDKGLPVELRWPVEETRETSLDEDEFSDEEDDVFDSDDPVALFFQHQLEAIKGIRVDDTFRERVKDYVSKRLISDVDKIKSGASRPPYFQMLLIMAAEELEIVLQKYQQRLNFLQELFDVGANTGIKKPAGQKPEDGEEKTSSDGDISDLESIVNLLGETKTAMLMTERRAYKILKDYSGSAGSDDRKVSHVEHETYELIEATDNVDGTPTNGSTRDKLKINKLFQITTGPWKTKQLLSVDVKRGKIKVSKSLDDSSEAVQVIKHDQILQLLKSKTYKNKLAVAMENKVMKNYQFEDFKSRELFCQLLQQMKNLHSSHIEKQQLSVFIGSWNMGDAPPPTDLTSWYQCQGLGTTRDAGLKDIPHDLIVIGTQETSFHEKDWVNKLNTDLSKALNCSYKLVSACSLWSLRLVIFIKSELWNKISHIKQSSVKTGIANTLGNKGAVGISFSYDTTSFCFINCHLTSGFERLKRRNENYHDILRGLKLGNDGLFDVTLNFNHCFWFGDLNYRIDLDTEAILQKIAKNNLETLLERDQLTVEQRQGNAFFGYDEAQIFFRPTYRYVRGETHMYSVTKVKRTGTRTNVPSWCDRILWRSYPGISVESTTYGCTEDILSSDHFPVFATFDVGILLQNALGSDCDNQQLSTKDVKISFACIQAKIRTSCNTKFILEIHSPCLEEPLSSYPNSFSKWKSLGKQSQEEDKLYSYPEWTQTDLPKVTPVLSYESYLEDQHFLIAVKGEDGHESYGECCISLKHLLFVSDEFSCSLTHLGYEAGQLRGKAVLSIPSRSQKSVFRDRDRDLISVADLDEEQEQQAKGTSDPLMRSLGQIDFTERDKKRSDSLLGQSELRSQLSKSAIEISRTDSDAPALPPKKRSSCSTMPLPSTKAPTFSWMAGSSEESFGKLPHDPIEPQEKHQDSPALENTDKNQTDQEEAPKRPVPRPRTLKSLLKRSPQTVGQWLRRIGLQQYEENLLAEGWDDLDFLDMMTEQDLATAGITDDSHQDMILKSAKLLKAQRQKEKLDDSGDSGTG